MPLPRSARRTTSPTTTACPVPHYPPRGQGKSKNAKKRERLIENVLKEERAKSAAAAAAPESSARAGGKGKGKGERLPKELVHDGNSGMCDDGSRICYGAQFEGEKACKKAKFGEKCPNGWHMCIKPSCRKPHAFLAHH